MEASPSHILRVALLGADATTLDMVRAVTSSHRFELAGICEPPDDIHTEQLFQAIAGRIQRFDAWEALLDSSAIDAVFVARAADQDLRAEQLRKLIQAGVPLVLAHPLFDSMLVYYELDMIRRETGSIVVPYLPARRHPAMRHLADLVAQGPASQIGKVEQLVIERSIDAPAKPGVVGHFARDVDLVRAVAGEMSRLGALAGTAGEMAYSSLGVQMSGPLGVAARWSVAPSRSERSRITLLGSSGRAVVHVPSGNEAWSEELIAEAGAEERDFQNWDAAAESLDVLALAMAGDPYEPNLVDAARSVELTETIDRSLLKGRTIELYFEEYTEEGTFKGTMTSLGCGLLVIGMLVLGAVAIGEQVGIPYVNLWPYFLIAGFALFLVMQLLLLVSRGKADRQANDSLGQPDRTPIERTGQGGPGY